MSDLSIGCVRRFTAYQFQEIVIAWELQNSAEYPWRTEQKLWLQLAAEMMLQRTRAEQVVPVFDEFRAQFPRPEDFLDASDYEKSRIFGRLGLRWRKVTMTNAAAYLCEQQPEYAAESLRRVPGVGDYVAAAVLSFHGGKRAVLIDSNIVRLLCRIEGREQRPEIRRVRWFRELCESLTPCKDVKLYNYGLLDLSRKVCRVKPICETCPLSSGCCSFAYGKRAE